MKTIYIVTDGGSRGNPGPSACAAVAFIDGAIVWTKTQFLSGNRTNNYAEYSAVILGLEEFIARAAVTAEQYNLVMLSDSTVIVKQINGEFRVDRKKDGGLGSLYDKVQNLLTAVPNFSIKYIPREYTKVADTLVNQCLDKEGNIDKDVPDFLRDYK